MTEAALSLTEGVFEALRADILALSRAARIEVEDQCPLRPLRREFRRGARSAIAANRRGPRDRRGAARLPGRAGLHCRLARFYRSAHRYRESVSPPRDRQGCTSAGSRRSSRRFTGSRARPSATPPTRIVFPILGRTRTGTFTERSSRAALAPATAHSRIALRAVRALPPAIGVQP